MDEFESTGGGGVEIGDTILNGFVYAKFEGVSVDEVLVIRDLLGWRKMMTLDE